MVYGRVIGNELRDVPPEYLPIWGQRWSGYRTPHGPSSFSIRVFSVDRMSEMGLPLTSPTRLELALTEEDETEDTSSESSQFRNYHLPSPSTIQTDATGLTSRAETPVPRSVYLLSNNPRDSPEILYWGTGHPSPQKSMQYNTTLLPRRHPEFSGTQHPASEPTSHTLILHHGIPTQDSHGLPQNDCTLWDMGRASTSFQFRDGHPHLSGQLQHAMSPHSIYEWQSADAHIQSPAHHVQLNPSSHLGVRCPLLPYQPDDRTNFIPMSPQSSSHCFTMPLPRHGVVVYPSRAHDPSVYPRYPMMPSWPQGSTLPTPSSPWPSQNSVSPSDSEVFYYSASDHHEKSTHPEGFS